MIIADRYDASDAIVEYWEFNEQEIMSNGDRSGRAKAMSHVESVSNTT